MFIKHNRISGNSISVVKGENVAYATFESSLAAIKDGSFLRFQGENGFYVVQRKEQVTLLYDFEVLKSDTISIKENLLGKIHSSDALSLCFREYELDIVVGILDAGTEYAVGDVLTVGGGKPSLDTTNGLYNVTQININGVKEDGKISRIGIRSRGRYIETPPTEIEPSGGAGKGAKFEITYKPVSEITKVERKIQSLDFKENETVLYLDAALPVFIDSGRLSCDKWLFYLATPYLSETRTGIGFSVSRDFTPVLNLPLMAPNSFTMDVVYNKAIISLEEEIVKLNQKLDLLTKRVNGS